MMATLRSRLFPQQKLSARQIAGIAFILMPFMLVWFRGGAELCMAVVSALFLFHSKRENDWGWLKSPFSKLILFTYAWIVLIVSPLALDPGTSFSRAILWIRYPLFLIAASQWLLKETAIRKHSFFSLAALLAFVLLDTLIQYVTGVSLTGNAVVTYDFMSSEGVVTTAHRLTGPLNNVKVGIFIAKLIFPACGFLLWRAWKTGNTRQMLSAALLLPAALLIILLSGERTAFITSLLGTLVFALIAFMAVKRARIAIASGLLVLLFGIGIAIITQPNVRERVAQLDDHIANFWEGPYGKAASVSIMLAKQYPLHGTGMNNYEAGCLRLKDAAAPQVTYCERHPHNPYFEWLVETGIPGLACFITLIFMLAYKPLRLAFHGSADQRLIAGAALACLTVHFFPFMAASSTVSNWPAMLLWCSLTLVMALTNMAQEKSA